MAAEFSFDIVSKVDFQEVDNAVNQAKKIILNRYDLKGTQCKIDFDKKSNQIRLAAGDKMKYETLLDILKERLAARNVPLKSLKYLPQTQTLGGAIEQQIEFQVGLAVEQAKTLTKMIRDLKLKVQAQILSDQIRVSGKSKDELQQVLSFMRAQELDIPLQFANFR